MNVTLTGEQFLKILTKHYGTEVNGFSITDADPSPKGKILRQGVDDPLDKSKFMCNIKGLRKIYEGMGKYITLAEAKWAVENWFQFIDFVDRTNRLPQMGFCSGKDKGKLY